MADIANAHRADLAARNAPPPLPVRAPVQSPAPAMAAADIAPQAPPEADFAVITNEPAYEPAPEPAGEPPPEETPQIEPAEPAAVSDAPGIVPDQPGAPPAEPDKNPGEDIETFAARRLPRRAARKRKQARRSGITVLILLLVAINLGLIGWRQDVVRYVPQTASFYAAIGLPVNLRGLEFANITTSTETHDGVQVLVVEGMIVSVTGRPVAVPRLRFAIRSESGHEIYAWTAMPNKNVIAPRDTLAFRSRLASPPPNGHDVLVRFFTKRDLVAGLQ
jgi:hypothetical protein